MTLKAFVTRLRRLARAVATRDPAGLDPALRLSVAHSLYSAFDALRCEDAPFDRAAFSARLHAVERLVAATLPGRGGRSRPAAERDPEAVVAELYSQCWAHYDDQAFLRTVDLFAERFTLNRVSLEFLRGAECLDAGCGSGRYTMAMARLGAARAVGVDISARAIREARQRWVRLALAGAVEFVRGSVIAMPSAWTRRFDFVCSNGVVHHTKDPAG
ncbi:MAG: methyltransferase domain-containing protein, partial [Gemmatimonadales bacterium]|nr:methyltransferase domain-containing protein [Gemmatimonadales bacterium]